MKSPAIRGILVLLLVLLISSPAGFAFVRQWRPDVIVEGSGVVRTGKLSEYFEGIKGTANDPDYYLLEGSEPGGTMILWGGTHPVEPAAFLAPILLIENARVTKGRIFIIPQINKSSFGTTKIGMGDIDTFSIKTPWGKRQFRFGGRGTNPIFSWPDPDVYTNFMTGQSLAGDESRNLNRTYPGRPNGYLTERLSFALIQMIKKEKADVAIDLHEAPPDRPLCNAFAVHERAAELATLAMLNLESQGIKMRLEMSPKYLRGLSHREIGDHTDAMALLFETQSPYHGPLRGRADEANLLTAKDQFLVLASKMGRTSVQHTEEGVPIDLRVARHVASIVETANALDELDPEKGITIEGAPTYQEMLEGIGKYFKQPDI
ncbi:MAG: succinylglutamate desuccinylase/aspartoacylase family protein [Syntrophorhabdaceae bacterium]|nr:succinylglutamate desuccinylase/aspartoacylase family protein [Syntrophorhabdaceae bacterium]